MSRAPLVGFLSPPAWYDPSPTEFLELCQDSVRVRQYQLPLVGFDWQIDSIARTEPDQLSAAQALGAAGCDLVATVGTPFCWAGLASVDDARGRCARLSAVAGVPNVMAGIAVLDAFEALGARKVGLACTYYCDDWRDRWSAFVSASGHEVVSAPTLADHGLMASHDAADSDYWAPTPDQVTATVRRLAAESPDVQAIAVCGAGARTLAVADDLEDDLGVPVIGSDTALYWAIAKTLRISLRNRPPGNLSL